MNSLMIKESIFAAPLNRRTGRGTTEPVCYVHIARVVKVNGHSSPIAGRTSSNPVARFSMRLDGILSLVQSSLCPVYLYRTNVTMTLLSKPGEVLQRILSRLSNGNKVCPLPVYGPDRESERVGCFTATTQTVIRANTMLHKKSTIITASIITYVFLTYFEKYGMKVEIYGILRTNVKQPVITIITYVFESGMDNSDRSWTILNKFTDRNLYHLYYTKRK